MLFFLILTAVIALILLICLFFQSRKSAPPDTSTYTPPSYLQEETIAQRPKISAEVSDDFYYAVKQYCSDYIGTCACGATRESPTPERPYYVRTDGSWKCPKCHRENASYIGTCVCGFAKE